MPFKIRRRKDGLFSSGGSRPSFSTKGKLWGVRGHLTNHLNIMSNCGRLLSAYHDCEIVEYEMTEVGTEDAQDYVNARHQQRVELETARKKRIEDLRREERYKTFLKLQREFNPNDDTA